MQKFTVKLIAERLKRQHPTVRIVAKTWVGANTLQKWLCTVCRKTWKARWGDVQQGHGCPRCSREKQFRAMYLTLAECKKRLAETHPSLKILSKEYVSARALLILECREGHKWKASWSRFIYKNERPSSGCPECKKNTLRDLYRFSLAELKARVKKLHPHLKVLSKKYDGAHSLLRVACRKCQHEWKAAWGNLAKKQCARCSVCQPRTYSVSEERVRRTLERLTGWKFPKASPSKVPWLNGLHLDGYNARHKVAFEYQGYQHYRVSHFGGGKKALASLKKRDMRKRVQCLRHKVLLICVPYWKKNVKAFLRKKLEHLI